MGKRRLHQLLSTEENIPRRRVRSSTMMKMTTIIPESRDRDAFNRKILFKICFWLILALCTAGTAAVMKYGVEAVSKMIIG